MKHLRITARAEKRLKSGHLWIYSNEFDTQFAPLKAIENGEQVAVENPQGRIIAYAFINPFLLFFDINFRPDHRCIGRCDLGRKRFFRTDNNRCPRPTIFRNFKLIFIKKFKLILKS